MAVFNKFQAFVEHVAEKVHNLQTDTLKVMLSNTAPVAANAVKLDLIEIAAGNGYVAGGSATAQVSSAQTAGAYKLVLTDVVITAVGGAIGPFRYVVLYNDTPTVPAKPLIGWYDYGAAATLNTGESLTVDFDGSLGVLTLA